MQYRNPFEGTPQSEAWVEAASWIAEEKRARLREAPTEEAFARLAFQLCMHNTLKKPTITRTSAYCCWGIPTL